MKLALARWNTPHSRPRCLASRGQAGPHRGRPQRGQPGTSGEVTCLTWRRVETRSLGTWHVSPVAAHAAEHVVGVVGADLQRLLGEDDLARRDVPRGHHVPPEPDEDTDTDI